MANSIDLQSLFSTVSQSLAEKKATLNEADSYNHNHGDHMVKIFNLIRSAVVQKSDQPVEEQLSYASKVVQQKADSGSAALYAQGLSKAAERFSGKDLNENTVSILLQSLLSAEKPIQETPSQGNDMLGSLLSGLAGQPTESAQSQGSQQSQGGNILGSLLSGLTGQSNETAGESDQSLGLDDLLQAGMTFFQSKQDGDTNIEAIMDVLMVGSPMKETPHRKQSASIVTETIMKFIGNMNK